MTDELIKRLRDRASFVMQGPAHILRTANEAANLIEQQAPCIAELQDAIRKQANAARSLADATIRDASIRQELAEKARAESSPEVLASERQANAMITEENERLTARIAALEAQIAALTGKLDGWKLVPVEPTETMVVDGFESWPSRIFSEPEDWAAYEAMSGCRQAAHKARLCYAAMLAAAPAATAATVAPAVDAQPVGVAGTMPGTDGFTMAAFKASEVPVGTPLYASAQSEGWRKDEVPDGVEVASYRLADDPDMTVQRIGQVTGPDLWAVRYGGNCLGKDGEWEYEPMPSSRDADFLARCRFASAQEAIDAAIRALSQKGQQ